MSYKVTLDPLGYAVNRTEDDFTSLRKYLCRIYSNQYIPPLVLPNSKVKEVAISKKEYYFTKFLTRVLNNHDLRGCDYLLDFLKIEDYKEFKMKKKLREKEKDPVNIQDFYSDSGKADVSFSDESLKASVLMPSFIEKYTEIQRNIKAASNLFIVQAEEIANTVFTLGKYYEMLGSIFNQIDISRMHLLSKVVSDTLTAWGNEYIQQKQIMHEKFTRHSTYFMNEGE